VNATRLGTEIANVTAIRELRSLGENMEALGISNAAFHDWRAELALALAGAGRREEALPLALAAVDRARAWGAPPALGVALRALGLVVGGASGKRLLGESVDVLERSQARLEHAKSLVELGAALRRGNKRGDSRCRKLEISSRAQLPAALSAAV
jgi:hypothetical protein